MGEVSDELCRVCLRSDVQLHHIDSMNELFSVSFREMYNYLIPLRLYNSGQLSTSICSQCAIPLKTSYDFVKQCKENIGFAVPRREENSSFIVLDSDEESTDQLLENFVVKLNKEMSSTMVTSSVQASERLPHDHQCEICQRSFLTKGLLKTHIFRHQFKNNQYKCRRCHKKFLVKTHYEEHECN